MNCTNCGTEVGNRDTPCPNCGAAVDRVQVLPPEERDDFQGLTIAETEEQTNRKDGYYEYKSEGPNHRVYVRSINFGNGRSGIWQKLIIGAVLIGLVIVALPFALVIIGILIVGWFISALFKR